MSSDRSFLLTAGATAMVLWLGVFVYRFYYTCWQPGEAITFPDPRSDIFNAPLGLNAAFFWAVGLTDPLGQRLAHQAMFGMLAALCLLGTFGRELFGPRLLRWMERGGIVAAAISLVLLPRLLAPEVMAAWWGPLVGIAAAILLLKHGVGMRRTSTQRAMAVLCLLLWAALFLPGIGLRVDYSQRQWSWIEEMQTGHWSLMLGVSDRLFEGMPAFSKVRMSYGGLSALGAAGLTRCFGRFQLIDYFRYICLLQSLCLAAALAGYYYVAKKRWDLCLAPLLLAGLQNHFYQEYACPNHTAWRSLWFPVAILLQIVMRNRSVTTVALVLGTSSALAMCQNPESGVAITVAHVVFLAFRMLPQWRSEGVKGLLSAATAFAAGELFGGGVFLAGCRAISGQWPPLGQMWQVVSVFYFPGQATYSGGRLQMLDPMAVLIFGHACYVLLSASTRLPWHNGSRQALRVSVAALIVVWFAYYANRPHRECLTSYYLLYGYLLIDLLRVLVDASRLRRARLLTAAAFLVLGLVVFPRIVSTLGSQYPHYRRGIQLVCGAAPAAPAVALSGVYFSDDTHVTLLKQRAEMLQEMSPDDRPIYLTLDSYLMAKQAGYWPMLSVGDVFVGAPNRAHYERLLREIVDSRVTHVLIDTDSLVIVPQTPSDFFDRLSAAKRFFFQKLRHDLETDFELSLTRSGWEVWRRKVQHEAERRSGRTGTAPQ